MRSVRTQLCGLALLALTTPAGADNWVVQIPVQTADGREVMLPLALTAQQDAKNQDMAPVIRIPENRSTGAPPGLAWSLYPQVDASQKIVFTKRGAQSWTVQFVGDDSF